MTPPILSPESPDNHVESDDEEGDIDKELSDGIRKLSIHAGPFRYHGRSSGMVFIRSAINLKNEYAGSRPASSGDAQHPASTRSVDPYPPSSDLSLSG